MIPADMPNEFFNSVFFDESDLRVQYANDVIMGHVQSSSIEIVRARHFFNFESVNVAEHIEEITFFNNGEIQNILYYYEPDFKEFLNIFDFNGEKLQFHGIYEDYFFEENNDNKEDQKNLDNDNNITAPFEILIDFPQQRPLLKNQFRTITLHDKLDYPPTKPSNSVRIEIPSDRARHTYVYIKKIPFYKVNFVKAFIPRENREDFFELEKSEEKEYLDEFETTSYYCFYSFVPITGCNLLFFIDYKLRWKEWLWFYSGIFLGVATFCFNLIFIFDNIPRSLSHAISISTIAITYLVVTKGWIFLKDIDDVVEVIPSSPIKIPFSGVYLLLILLIFLELCAVFYFPL